MFVCSAYVQQLLKRSLFSAAQLAAESIILTKANSVLYLNSTLKRFSLESPEISFGIIALIFMIFLLEQGGWKARNDKKAGNFNSEVLDLAKNLY